MEKEKRKRIALSELSPRQIISLILFLALLFGGLFGGVFLLLNTVLSPVIARGDDFLTALQEERFEDAYAFLTSETQALVSLEGFQATFAPMQIESWSYNQRSVKNGIGLLRGSITIDGQAQNLSLMFQQEAGTWQIVTYSFGN